MGHVNEKKERASALESYGVNMKYSYIDSRKNWAAVFDGTSYVLVSKISNLLIFTQSLHGLKSYLSL